MFQNVRPLSLSSIYKEARAALEIADKKKLAQITVERGCGRLEWACLDWNQPSIDFYRSLGAVPMDEWTTYRLTGDTLLEMVK